MVDKFEIVSIVIFSGVLVYEFCGSHNSVNCFFSLL